MYNRDEQGTNTEELLLDRPRVCSIERTYQTKSRGHWLLVVQAGRVKELGKYMESNIQKIYGNRRGQTPKWLGTNTSIVIKPAIVFS